MKSSWERTLETALFASRWLLAPLYLGMIVAVGTVLFVFARELIAELGELWELNNERVILLALSLVDLSLTANLLFIVIFAGYENFVSKIDIGDHEDRPDWMGAVDFAGLKIKLIASIIAISAIALLRVFLPLGESVKVDPDQLRWMVIIHLTFVASGVLMAVMDWVTSKADSHEVHK